MTTELKLCFIKLTANLCSEQSNIRRNTPSPVEIHSPPDRLSTTPEDLNYGIYQIQSENLSVLPHQKIMNKHLVQQVEYCKRKKLKAFEKFIQPYSEKLYKKQ
ncbi:hypothetical protein T09_9274 [Trichinella sp. T9]|uniref:Uncharacterized protein n=1 Tax=Trichinella murrelli TaxID=144512 RepID=A0A0V0TF98_9BILA|nr:hypothetical protein T05_179 [Trichinella murrelli]KRX52881.1 hypothetical protein T09_9274 [Trichinella sp. T9]